MPLLDIMQAFESFSEDPFLAGHLAAGYVNGLQQEGVGGVLKHLVCNDMEHERFSASVTVEDRRKSSLADGIVSIAHLNFFICLHSLSRSLPSSLHDRLERSETLGCNDCVWKDQRRTLLRGQEALARHLTERMGFRGTVCQVDESQI